MKMLQGGGKALLHPPRFAWKLFVIALIASLLAMSAYFVSAPAPVLAQQEGEQTAELLPEDTEIYFTVNLSPGANQTANFWAVVNDWWPDPAVQEQWQQAMDELESQTGIDFEQDVLSWLDSEIAIGMRNVTAGQPEMILLIGTTDRDASYNFSRKVMGLVAANALAPWLPPDIIEEVLEDMPTSLDDPEFDTPYYELPPGGWFGQYNGIPIATFLPSEMGIGPSYDVYWASSDDYIILSTSSDLFYETLDLILNPALPSLWDSDNFQEARAALPEERVCMVYVNYEQTMVDLLSPYDPAYVAASLQFTSTGIVTTAFYPLPEALAPPPTTEPDLLQSAYIVPGGAWLFSSGQDMNAYWQQIKSSLADSWADIAPLMGIDPQWMPFNEFMDLLESDLGFSLDEDVFGWMTGEFAIAMLPLPLEPDTGDSEFPDFLILFEVEDTSAVQGHLMTVVNAINAMNPGDPLQTTATTIDGVTTTLFTNDAITAVGASPGWLFLDVDTTHYLVLGPTTDALAAAVDASQGNVASLVDAAEYQGVLSLLPETKMSLTYVNLSGILDAVFSQFSNLIPLQCALGLSTTMTENAVTMTGVLYLPIKHWIEAGKTGIESIPEQTMDFSWLDSDVGQCAVSIDTDIIDAPAGANIQVIMMKEPTEEVLSGFELAATDTGLSIQDVAYVVRVDKTNLGADNIGTATITMKVGRAWADEYGTDNIKIFRIGDDGTRQVLDTTFVGYADGETIAIFQAISPGGLSTFGLIATAPAAGPNWALIGGIIGGVLAAAGIGTAVFFLRRRPRPV